MHQPRQPQLFSGQEHKPDKPAFVQFNHWDQALKQFLIDMGLTHALKGLENDMLVLNPDWEKERIPFAMATFVRNLVFLNKSSGEERSDGQDEKMDVDSDLDQRKLAYVRSATGANPQSQTSINKTISQFIARNRARNNASNRAEFLHSLDEIRTSMASAASDVDTSSWASCARTDMKTIDRDAQMKYDIARNEDGPLKRTMKATETKAPDQLREKPGSIVAFSKGTEQELAMSLTPDKHPGLDERLVNIERHLAVRYVPSPPKSFLDRLKFLEDHLVQLEMDYPPWAALHFNQPNRGWPPPPRSTPIVVPPHMRAVASSNTGGATISATARTSGSGSTGQTPVPVSNTREFKEESSSAGSKTRGTPSSLQKAVMEKLEVYQAMNDLAGRSG
ncbi:hypothetical protein APHAL10511_006925 [Amanita phalloides]|nr:hypothetical protein APHAL10511_006925 [Amanita phalloides]